MARIRQVKPEFFLDEDLAEVDFGCRLLFEGLWCLADRKGRLEDRPLRIKAQVLPHDNVDIDKMLDILHSKNFIQRYEVDSRKYIQIRTFEKHQHPHVKEPESTMPAPGKHRARTRQALGKNSSCTSESGLRNLDNGILSTDTDSGVRNLGTSEETVVSSSCAEPEKSPDSTPECQCNAEALLEDPQPLIVIRLPILRGEQYAITQDNAKELQGLYPAVDVVQQLREMRAWCLANPKKLKTRKGILRFVTAWLGKEQDKGGSLLPRARSPGGDNWAHNEQAGDRWIKWSDENDKRRQSEVSGRDESSG